LWKLGGNGGKLHEKPHIRAFSSVFDGGKLLSFQHFPQKDGGKLFSEAVLSYGFWETSEKGKR